jgi:hypothetical protein
MKMKMSELKLQLKSLMLVRDLLSVRGTDVSALELEIERLRSKLQRRTDLATAA